MRKKKTGPKTEQLDDPLHRKSLYLDARTVRLLDAMGGGNVSKGARVCARYAYEQYQLGRFKP